MCENSGQFTSRGKSFCRSTKICLIIHILCLIQFTERALARHLVDPLGGPSSKYFICLAQLKLQRHEMDEVEALVKDAMQLDHQVSEDSVSLYRIRTILNGTPWLSFDDMNCFWG